MTPQVGGVCQRPENSERVSVWISFGRYQTKSDAYFKEYLITQLLSLIETRPNFLIHCIKSWMKKTSDINLGRHRIICALRVSSSPKD